MKFLKVLFLSVLLFVAAIGAYMWSGRYNVAANEPHWEITRWMLEEARDRSITFHSRGIVSPSLENPSFMKKGFHAYHESCQLCHGAPGYPRSDFAMGLYPSPPNLLSGKVQGEWQDAELYWIVRNGLKMTGMPAFGSSHEDDELWGMVVFVRRLPKLPSGAYEDMVREAELAGEKEEQNRVKGQ